MPLAGFRRVCDRHRLQPLPAIFSGVCLRGLIALQKSLRDRVTNSEPIEVETPILKASPGPVSVAQQGTELASLSSDSFNPEFPAMQSPAWQEFLPC